MWKLEYTITHTECEPRLVMTVYVEERLSAKETKKLVLETLAKEAIDYTFRKEDVVWLSVKMNRPYFTRRQP